MHFAHAAEFHAFGVAFLAEILYRAQTGTHIDHKKLRRQRAAANFAAW